MSKYRIFLISLVNDLKIFGLSLSIITKVLKNSEILIFDNYLKNAEEKGDSKGKKVIKNFDEWN